MKNTSYPTRLRLYRYIFKTGGATSYTLQARASKTRNQKTKINQSSCRIMFVINARRDKPDANTHVSK